jgi:hypothetical protein
MRGLVTFNSSSDNLWVTILSERIDCAQYHLTVSIIKRSQKGVSIGLAE